MTYSEEELYDGLGVIAVAILLTNGI